MWSVLFLVPMHSGVTQADGNAEVLEQGGSRRLLRG